MCVCKISSFCEAVQFFFVRKASIYNEMKDAFGLRDAFPALKDSP